MAQEEQRMKKCEKYGAELPDDALFCHVCGERLAEGDQNIITGIPEAKGNLDQAEASKGMAGRECRQDQQSADNRTMPYSGQRTVSRRMMIGTGIVGAALHG